MLNFDAERFLKIETGAVALAAEIDAAAARYVAEGIDSVFFLGTGGAAILMYPAASFLASHSRLKVFTERSAELVLTDHRSLGPRSLVVIPSLSGTTRESIAALDFCRARGARILTLVGHADTPLGRQADRAFVNFAEDDTSSESFYIQGLLLALSLLQHRGEANLHKVLAPAFARLPQALLAAKSGFEARAGALAAKFKDEPYHIITGAGSAWPQAFYYGMCILEEMQWIRTRPVHASDFFHGTLELVEKGVSVVLFKSEDEYRPVGERVEQFARQYTDKLTVIDPREASLPDIPPALRALLSPVILATQLERLSAHIEQLRNHPLTTRRYYKRVAY
ncbi:SIS domain-containing protein [Taklimakanibacter lacteus]|uniref:SIS domain-containing protein n=1 Tax=Taklimakanibacter lacteus TaxID=2268456 RepID=UPI000E6656C9